MMQEKTYVAKTLRSLEGVLAKELTLLGAKNVKEERRAVSFTGDKEILYRANFACRTALRILMPIATFNIRSVDDVYEGVKKIAWDNYFDTKNTFLIETTVFSSIINNSRFATYRVKDAIVDYFQEKYNKRPSISVANPDFYINLHIAENTCTISLDSSGEPLFKRGYRKVQTEAPLNEVLAAGMLLLSSWNGESDFIDPMCGSGTIAIEAALIALNIAPGVFRQGFAFEKWKDFDADLFDTIYNDDSAEREFKHKIYASDISKRAVAAAMENIKSAGLSKYIELKTMDFKDIEPLQKEALIVTNPPYGLRIGADSIDELYAMMGTTLKHKCQGATAWVLSSNINGFNKIALKADTKITLLNGDVECQFREYKLFSGKRRNLKNS